ncbi:tetratricopeptide repeat protein [Herbiconiux sp. VKM Ac-2851]|uniref:tetratricopeptide repeat protein n=1 Tax=Herbiconiux sp. VKM Ac-2851 TaxID=2739025 RepID=UPI0015668980|nr:tetratricopeptide repeat protein [Herbiconiux sp. VKM Ac-2851]NQX37155.1 tetratricopeptide repeat protein [Herbiconiux sp. VKM Ac-2851]
MTDANTLRTAFRQGDSAAVKEVATLQIEEARRLGDTAGEVEGLYALARVALRDQDLPVAGDIAQEALAVAQQTGDRRLEERPLHVLAAVARLSGDHATATVLYEASIDLNRALGNEVNVHTESHNLALSELQLGHIDRARELMAASINRVRQGHLEDFVPYLGIAGAALALTDGDLRRTARLIGFADQAFAGIGQVPDPDDASELAALRRRVVAEIGATAVQTELATGASWSLAEAFGGTWPRASGPMQEDDDA